LTRTTQRFATPRELPGPRPAANGDDTSGTDDEDAFTTLPDVVAVPGATYSLTVPIAGLSKSATLCGWIDFDRNGTFDTGERQCATPAAGATSATLTWTVTSGVSIGSSNARFRLGYTASQVQSPTGLADSGEVEDYPISFLARPQVVLTKTTTGAVGGPFAYTLTNTTQAGRHGDDDCCRDRRTGRRRHGHDRHAGVHGDHGEHPGDDH